MDDQDIHRISELLAEHTLEMEKLPWKEGEGKDMDAKERKRFEQWRYDEHWNKVGYEPNLFTVWQAAKQDAAENTLLLKECAIELQKIARGQWSTVLHDGLLLRLHEAGVIQHEEVANQ